MSDDEFAVIFFMFLGMSVLVLRLWYVNRKLKKKLRLLETPAPAAAMPAPAAQPERSNEVEDLRRRVQVLERIATDGNPTLTYEIEALRRA